MDNDLTKSPLPAADAAWLNTDGTVRSILDNGVTVLAREDHSAQLASLQVWVKTGSIHEGGLLGAGLSHFLEHMLFKGTERRGPLDISREVHAVGGSINAYTTYDRTVYHIDLPVEHLDRAFDILADMCLHACLPEAETGTEKDVILREIDMGLDDPDHRLFQKFVSTAYREHPYRYPVIGYRQLVEDLSSDDLRAYFNGRYVPGNMVVVGVGAFDMDAFQQQCQHYFGGERTRRLTPAGILPEPAQLAVRRTVETGDVQVTRGLMGFKIPGLSHRDGPALEVLAQILARGRSSMLWQRLREKDGWVHQIDGACWNPGTEGLLWVGYTCDPAKGAGVEAAIHEEIERVCRGDFSQKLLHKVVRQAVVAEINARKSMSGQASRLGSAEVVAGELDFPRIHLKLLQAVSSDQVREVGVRYLTENHMTSVLLAPAAKAVRKRANRAGGTALPAFAEHELANGARLLLQPVNSLPKLHIRTAFLGGALFEEPQHRGAASLLATLMTRDTARRNAREVAEAMEEVGGMFADFCGNNAFGLTLETLPGDQDLALEILQQALLEPVINDATLERERDAQIAAIHEDEDEILEFAIRRMRTRFFGQHPLAVDSLGRIGDLAAMTREDLLRLRAHLIVPANTVIAVSGQFDPDDLVPRLESILQSLPDGGHTPAVKSGRHLAHTLAAVASGFPPGPAEVGTFGEYQDRGQAVVLAAFPDVGVGDPAFRVGDVTHELFSGMSSRLFQKVREEKGLAYFVGAHRLTGLERGMFLFYAGTHPAQAGTVLEEIHAECARVRQGDILPGQIEACRAHMKARHRMGLQAPGARAMQAALNALYHLPVNQWQTLDAEIDAIDAAGVVEYIRGWGVEQKALNLIVGPCKNSLQDAS